MRTYETIFIVHPDTVGDEYAGIVEKFKGVLTDQGAEILKVDEWGTRKLAYPIRKQGRGTYVFVVHQAGPQVIAEFERRLRLDDAILKFQTIHLEKGYQAEPEEEKPEGGEGAEETEGGEGTEGTGTEGTEGTEETA